MEGNTKEEVKVLEEGAKKNAKKLKYEFPEGFFSKKRPKEKPKKYIAVEKPTDSGGYIEVVSELVLCKDCKFAKLIDEADDWHECWHDKRVMHGDGYCSWAERKEE